MPRYALTLPTQLKQEAERWATQQGVSLDQFILWALAEKVGSLSQQLDDPAFPHVTYRSGASGQPAPVVRGTGIRVQTLGVAARQWELLLAADTSIKVVHAAPRPLSNCSVPPAHRAQQAAPLRTTAYCLLPTAY